MFKGCSSDMGSPGCLSLVLVVNRAVFGELTFATRAGDRRGLRSSPRPESLASSAFVWTGQPPSYLPSDGILVVMR